MIKARGSYPDGKPLVILGLSEDNLRHASQNEPIKVELSELGLPPMTLLIVSGESEETITAGLREVFTIGDFIDKKSPYENRKRP